MISLVRIMNMKHFCIEIDKNAFNKKQNIVIGVVYRPPDTDMKSVNSQIDTYLSKIKAEKNQPIWQAIGTLTY